MGQSFNVPDAETAFHVYAINWTEAKMEFFIDDNLYLTFPASADWTKWPFNKRFHLLLNIAVGGNLGGGVEGVDDNAFPMKMKVDYV